MANKKIDSPSERKKNIVKESDDQRHEKKPKQGMSLWIQQNVDTKIFN